MDTLVIDAAALPESDLWRPLRELTHCPEVQMVSLYARRLPQDWLKDGLVEKADAGGRLIRAPDATEDPSGSSPAPPSACVGWPGKDLGLSEREVDVLALIADGESNEAIARLLNISLNTVKSYIRSAYQKIQVTSRSQSVRWSVEHGLCDHIPSVVNAVRRFPDGS